MVAEIGVHDDDEGARGGAQAVRVGGAEAELAGTRPQEDACGAVEFLELLRDGEGAVGGGVVDDYDFVGEVAVDWGGVGEFWVGFWGGIGRERVGELLFCEGAVEEPDYDGEVAAFVVLGFS